MSISKTSTFKNKVKSHHCTLLTSENDLVGLGGFHEECNLQKKKKM